MSAKAFQQREAHKELLSEFYGIQRIQVERLMVLVVEFVVTVD